MVMNFTKPREALADDVPTFFRIRGACLPHGSFMHPGKNGIGQLEHIREAFFRRLFAGAEDFLAIDIVLHRLEFGGGEVGIGRGHDGEISREARELNAIPVDLGAGQIRR